jgi:HlyD family secretion protein
MSKTKITLIAVAAIAVIALSVFWLQRNKPIPVTLAAVEKGEIQRTVTNTRAGTLNACRRAKLSPSLGGQIARLPVTEGE